MNSLLFITRQFTFLFHLSLLRFLGFVIVAVSILCFTDYFLIIFIFPFVTTVYTATVSPSYHHVMHHLLQDNYGNTLKIGHGENSR